jgi:hypothetical protein
MLILVAGARSSLAVGCRLSRSAFHGDRKREVSPLAAGTEAPDFALRSTPDQTLSLSDLRGRPVARFQSDLTEHAYAPRVREDFMSGVRSGVNGTPTFYIDGVRYEGSYDAEPLLDVLHQAAA